MRKPGHRRDDPKARKVVAPPSGMDLAQVAAVSRHVGSPHHKDRPGFAGVPNGRRPDAGIRTGDLANERDRIEGRLCDAVRAGNTGAWNKGFPRYLRHREGDTVLETRRNSPEPECNHGHPPAVGRRVQGLP